MLQCIDSVTSWTTSNRLKLNPDKTEFMWCSTSRMNHNMDQSNFVIGNASIEPRVKVQWLGVTLDSDPSMNSHVSRTIGACFYQLRRPKSIRCSLPISATRTSVSAFVLSRCDNHNGLFAGVTNKRIGRLQPILNASAKLIYGVVAIRSCDSSFSKTTLATLPSAHSVQAVHGRVHGSSHTIACLHPRDHCARSSNCRHGATQVGKSWTSGVSGVSTHSQ